jgi:hypothetical protein
MRIFNTQCERWLNALKSRALIGCWITEDISGYDRVYLDAATSIHRIMNRLLFVIASLCFTTSLQAALPPFSFTVSAGKHDRMNVPVCLQLPPGALQNNEIGSVTLVGTDRKPIPAQQTQSGLFGGKGSELHFILPHLKSGESLRLTARFSANPAPGGEGFAWDDHPPKYAALRFGQRAISTYYYERLDESTPESRVRTYKVFHHLYSPDGERILTNGLNEDPKVHSPHHRGIFYGFNRISYGNRQTADTWHCINGAYQQHERFLSSEAGPVLARHRMLVSWHGKDRAFAEEERELTFYNVSGGTLVQFDSRMKSLGGKVRFDGDPQHAGFQFRAHNDVDAFTTNLTIYVRTDGIGEAGDTRNWDPKTRKGPVNLPWNGMSFVLGDKRYTVGYIDSPKNPKESRFSERNFGRFGSYFEYDLDEGKTLNVSYRLWLQDGLMKPEQVAALSDDFVEPPTVKVEAR